MAYQARFTDITKEPLIVEDSTIDQSTSISLPGRNTTGYGQLTAENFLHLLENFANNEAPATPVEGQLWYDTTVGINRLKVYTGTSWVDAGGLKKGSTEPDSSSTFPGDLWVNIDTQQLFLFTGSGWILVGPRFSSGVLTGAEPEVIRDTTNISRNVITQYSDGQRVAIISKDTFTPNIAVEGFPQIKVGVNLNANIVNNQYWGVAEKALKLVVTNGPSAGISADAFLRNDQSGVVAGTLTVDGVNVGNSALSLSLDDYGNAIISNRNNASIDLKIVNSSNVSKSAIKIDNSNNELKVGVNNSTPTESLDLVGNFKTTGTIKTASTAVNSIDTAGGVSITGSLNVGGASNLIGEVRITSSLEPTTDSLINLGSASKRFARLYSKRIDGDVYGTVFGSLIGNVTGSSSKLASATRLRIEGDITSTSVDFDGFSGQIINGVKTQIFQTQLSDDFIYTKSSVTSINDDDEILIGRGALGPRKIKKSDLWKQISKTPVGSIMAFAGSVAPTGWLLCDGREVLTSDYADLYSILGNIYGTASIPGSYFKLPDLRGRFLLGLDNMGGVSANRVSSAAADNLGTPDGAQQVNIQQSNLPDHEHNFVSDQGNQYYAFRNDQTASADEGILGNSADGGTNQGSYLASSGGILTASALSQPLNVMNPFMAINYIIFTGKDV